jgi:hypothetical protein
MPEKTFRAMLPLHREGEELLDLLLRIDGYLFHGRPLCDPGSPVDRLHLIAQRQALAKVVYPRKPGNREKLPPEAWWALPALDQLWEVEQAKPRRERRSQLRLVTDYIRDAIHGPLVSPQRLLALWRREGAAAVARRRAK